MTDVFAELCPPPRILMGPGPSDVHPRVAQALGRSTVGHLDPYYLSVMNDVQQLLRWSLNTTNPMTFAVSGTGSAGMEAAVVNLVEPGDSMLVAVNGVFGKRMQDVAKRAGAQVTTVERPWGEAFDPDEIKRAISKASPSVVGIVMAETSTGVWQSIEEIASLVHAAGAMLIVDAVTSWGGMPVRIDDWKVDVVYSGSQKCLSCPPGLAPVSFSPRAVERVLARKVPVQSWYLDLTMLANYWGSDRVYHHTAPINMTYGLYEALRIFHEEGQEACFARHRLHHLALAAGLEAIGIDFAVSAERRLPMLNAVLVPSGVDDARVRKGLLERFGIEIGAGLGDYKGKVWRIGLMGYSARATNVLALLGALEQLLLEQSVRLEPGASVAAANQVYQQAASAMR